MNKKKANSRRNIFFGECWPETVYSDKMSSEYERVLKSLANYSIVSSSGEEMPEPVDLATTYELILNLLETSPEIVHPFLNPLELCCDLLDARENMYPAITQRLEIAKSRNNSPSDRLKAILGVTFFSPFIKELTILHSLALLIAILDSFDNVLESAGFHYLKKYSPFTNNFEDSAFDKIIKYFKKKKKMTYGRALAFYVYRKAMFSKSSKIVYRYIRECAQGDDILKLVALKLMKYMSSNEEYEWSNYFPVQLFKQVFPTLYNIEPVFLRETYKCMRSIVGEVEYETNYFKAFLDLWPQILISAENNIKNYLKIMRYWLSSSEKFDELLTEFTINIIHNPESPKTAINYALYCISIHNVNRYFQMEEHYISFVNDYCIPLINEGFFRGPTYCFAISIQFHNDNIRQLICAQAEKCYQCVFNEHASIEDRKCAGKILLNCYWREKNEQIGKMIYPVCTTLFRLGALKPTCTRFILKSLNTEQMHDLIRIICDLARSTDKIGVYHALKTLDHIILEFDHPQSYFEPIYNEIIENNLPILKGIPICYFEESLIHRINKFLIRYLTKYVSDADDFVNIYLQHLVSIESMFLKNMSYVFVSLINNHKISNNVACNLHEICESVMLLNDCEPNEEEEFISIFNIYYALFRNFQDIFTDYDNMIHIINTITENERVSAEEEEEDRAEYDEDPENQVDEPWVTYYNSTFPKMIYILAYLIVNHKIVELDDIRTTFYYLIKLGLPPNFTQDDNCVIKQLIMLLEQDDIDIDFKRWTCHLFVHLLLKPESELEVYKIDDSTLKEMKEALESQVRRHNFRSDLKATHTVDSQAAHNLFEYIIPKTYDDSDD